MPRYRLDQDIFALQIKSVRIHEAGAEISFVEEGYGPIDVDFIFLASHQPNPGMFYVHMDEVITCIEEKLFNKYTEKLNDN